MGEHKRIGILTSGGDCAGLNAAIRAVVYRASGTFGWEVFGIREATQGLMTRPVNSVPLTIDKVDNILTAGGTILGTTNKGDPFAFPMPDGSLLDRSEEIIEGYHLLGLNALIGIGGDGSLAILRRIAQQGNLNLIGIPKTIDNDVGSTDLSIGFSTAVDIATEALDRLHFTAASHSRVMILEVMGRDAGHIALHAGIAGGADIILIPEIPYSLDRICTQIAERQKQGKNYCLGGIGQYLADEICARSGAETRVTVLGHIQRGGTPSPIDRIIASAFGVAAVDLIAEDKYDQVVVWRDRQVANIPILDAIAQYRAVNANDILVETARSMGICLGD